MPTPKCVYTPPEGHDIQPYLTRLIGIITQLNETQNKSLALDRLQLLMDDIDNVIKPDK